MTKDEPAKNIVFTMRELLKAKMNQEAILLNMLSFPTGHAISLEYLQKMIDLDRAQIDEMSKQLGDYVPSEIEKLENS